MSHPLRRELVKLQSALNSGPPYQARDGKWSRKMEVQGVQRFLQFFTHYGTHYVSKVVTGDVIFQIFAYEAPVFEYLKSLYQKYDGHIPPAAILAFRKFTTPAPPLPGHSPGYASQIGHLCIKSGASSFQQQLVARRWMDETIGNPSIFDCAAQKERLGNGEQLIPIYYEMAEILGFTRPVLKKKATSLFKALLFSKYENGADVVFQNPPIEHPFQVQKNSAINALMVDETKDGLWGYKNLLQAEDLPFSEAAAYQNWKLLSPLFILASGHTNFPSSHAVHIMAHTILVEGTGAEIVLSHQAYQAFQISCEDFYGALRVRDASTGETYTLVDGFRYHTPSHTADPTANEIPVCGAINDTQPEQALACPASQLEYSLLEAENLLDLSQDPVSDRSKINTIRYLNWLFGLFSSDEEAFIQLRTQGWYLARVMAKLEKTAIAKPQAVDLANLTEVLERLKKEPLKHRLAVQQQWFQLQQSAQSQIWLPRLQHQVQQMVADYAALADSRHEVREKLSRLVQRTRAAAELAEQDLRQQQENLRERIQWAENQLSSACYSPLLKTVFQSASSCLLPEPLPSYEAHLGSKDAENWWRILERLQKLQTNLALLAKAYHSPTDLAVVLNELGRNGLVWLHEKEWLAVTDGFESLTSQELEADESSYLDAVILAFRQMIEAGRRLMHKQARLLWYACYDMNGNYYERRHEAQRDELQAVHGLDDEAKIGTLMAIYQLHEQLYQRMSRQILLLAE